MEPKPTPHGWGHEIEAWALAMRSAGFAEPSIATRTDHLRRCARAVGQQSGPWEITSEDLVTWTGQQNWARATRRSVHASLKSFWRWGHGSGRTDNDPALLLPRIPPGPPKPRPTPESILDQAIMDADSRGQLILRLAAEAGLRRAEIAAVHSRDLLDHPRGTALVVHGKGDRERVVPLPADLAADLRARGEGFVFPGDDDGHLSPRWVGKIATRLLPGDWTLHSLRHRYATVTHRHKKDLMVVQKLLGHASLTTTQLYVDVLDDDLWDTAAAASRQGRRHRVA